MIPSRPPIRRRSVLGTAAALAGVGRAVSASGAGAAPLTLGWRAVSPSGVVVLAATNEGLFGRNGVAVTLRAERPGDPSFEQQLHSGMIDACVVPAPILLVPMKNGLDARFTAGLSGGGLRLLADRHAGLRHIEDVKHRRIGVADIDGPARLFFSVMLRRKGINPFAEVTWVATAEADMASALRERTVDAIALSDPDGFALARSMKLTEIASNASGSYRERTFAALAVSDAVLRGRRDAAAAVTRALLAAAHLVATRRKEAVAIARTIAPASLDDAALADMLRTEAPDQHPTGSALVNDIAAYVDELRLLGTMPFELNSGRFARSVCEDLVAA